MNGMVIALKRAVALATVAAAFFVFWSAPAHAYLDPGTGSMIVQVIIGGIAAGLVAFKMFWARLVGLFRRDAGEGRPLDAELRD